MGFKENFLNSPQIYMLDNDIEHFKDTVHTHMHTHTTHIFTTHNTYIYSTQMPHVHTTTHT